MFKVGDKVFLYKNNELIRLTSVKKVIDNDTVVVDDGKYHNGIHIASAGQSVCGFTTRYNEIPDIELVCTNQTTVFKIVKASPKEIEDYTNHIIATKTHLSENSRKSLYNV